MWQTTGTITVTSTSAPFFGDLVASAAPGTYAADTATYRAIYDAVFAYADGFLDVVARYSQANGSLAEQFGRGDGAPLSARDLTWSYAAFLTAAARRAGVVPAGWAGGAGAASATSVPAVCSATSRAGSYAAATATSFPPSQTPTTTTTATGTGTFTLPTATTTRTTAPCATATAVAVSFSVRKATVWGQTVKIAGSAAALGAWDTSKAVVLSAAGYTDANPVWSGTVTLPAGAAVQYKYIVVEQDGSVSWEADPNRSWTVPRTCATSSTRSDSWQ